MSQKKKTCDPKPNSLSYSRKGHAKQYPTSEAGYVDALFRVLPWLPESQEEKSNNKFFSLPFLLSSGPVDSSG